MTTMQPGDVHLGSTIATSAFGVLVLQWLKNQKWFPWLKQEGTAALNRAAAIATSGMAALGITYAFTVVPGGGHVLSINIPSLATMGVFLWAWAKSFAVQEWIYQSGVNKK